MNKTINFTTDIILGVLLGMDFESISKNLGCSPMVLKSEIVLILNQMEVKSVELELFKRLGKVYKLSAIIQKLTSQEKLIYTNSLIRYDIEKIARICKCSPKTLKSEIVIVFKKLGIRNPEFELLKILLKEFA